MYHRLAATVTALGLSLVVGLSTAAWGADLGGPAPVYTKAPAATPWIWTGFYVGATAGGAWSRDKVSLNTVNGASALYFPTDLPALNALGSSSIKGSSAIFGGKLGYNYQWSSIVAGLEADISSFHINRSVATTGAPFAGFPNPPFFATFNTNVSTTWLATVRPRVGYAVDHVLFYGTGGLAVSNVKFANTYLGFSPLGAGFEREAASASGTKFGWAAGGGIEYAVSPNWILGVEYLHVDLGSIAASGLVTTGNPNTATMSFSSKLQSDLVRGSVSYKF